MSPFQGRKQQLNVSTVQKDDKTLIVTLYVAIFSTSKVIKSAGLAIERPLVPCPHRILTASSEKTLHPNSVNLVAILMTALLVIPKQLRTQLVSITVSFVSDRRMKVSRSPSRFTLAGSFFALSFT